MDPLQKKTILNQLLSPWVFIIAIGAMAFLSLVLSLWGGLVRIGWWHYKDTIPGLPGIHGPLVVCGFLGTFFSLERAISLKIKWGFLVPLAVVCGALSLVFSPLWVGSRIIITFGSFGFVALCMTAIQRDLNFFNSMIALGSIFWLSGMIIWWVDWPVFNIYLWWMGFVLLAIVGQRLEVAQRVHLNPQPIGLLGMTLTFVMLGQLLMAVGHQTGPDSQISVIVDGIYDPRLVLGMRLSGIGMLGTAIWLLRYDASWQLIRNRGMAGYIAINNISSYLWLAITGCLSIIFTGIVSGVRYDALIHSFFIGFVMFGIFGKSPGIAVSLIGIRYKNISYFYFHVVLLHFALILRLLGDGIRNGEIQKWGGMVSTVALLLFIISIVYWISKNYINEDQHES